MGTLFAKLFTKMEANIVMMGLDSAGKTTILYKMKLGEIISTIPTIGMNVDTVRYKNLSLTCFDVGGRSPIRALYRFYLEKCNAIIWVIDSNDKDRINEINDEIRKIVSYCPQMKSLPILIFANKQDLPNAMKLEEITNHIEILKTWEGSYFMQASCATSGDGLYEGLDWLNTTIKQQILTTKA